MSDDCNKCCEPKKKVFQGKAYIPDDHIQLISKYFQGANLNLNFTVNDEESSDKDCRKKKRKTRSRSRKRCRKKRKRKAKRCKCCKCHEDKCELPKSSCCGTLAKCPPKPKKRTCCEQLDLCPPPPRNCCDVKPDPCGAALRCEGRTHVAPVKTSICCCEKPVEPEPQKLCCCCGRPCVENNKDGTKSPNETKPDTKGQTKGKSATKLVEEGIHRHTSCCCKCTNLHDTKEEVDNDENRMEVSKNERGNPRKKGSKKPTPITFSESSDSTKSSTGGNVKQVYVTKKVSSLENDQVYGRYWYHRPPLGNTITHCDDDNFPGPSGSGYRTDVGYRNGYRNDRQPYEDGCPNDGRPHHTGRPYPPNPTYNNAQQQHIMHHRTDRFRSGAGRCLACKEPMCLLCKMTICECACDKPNFVICNPCKHILTPRPPNKPCPPKNPKNKIQQADGGCEEAMFLLPLLASMQGNNNFQHCNC